MEPGKTYYALEPVFVSPAYATAVAEVRRRKALSMYLGYLEYKAALLRSGSPLAPAGYEHFLNMLDYWPDPEK